MSKHNQRGSILGDFANGLLLAVLIWLLFYVLWSTPIVEWSRSTGACHDVFLRGEFIGCDDIPERHFRVPVR